LDIYYWALRRWYWERTGVAAALEREWEKGGRGGGMMWSTESYIED